MLKFFFVITILITSSSSQAEFQDFCTIISKNNPEFETGAFKEIICRDAIATLTKETNYLEGYPLNLQITSTEKYKVSFNVYYILHETNYTLKAYEVWHQGNSEFILEK